MIASKAFLKGIAAELILASGLGAGLPARAQQAAPVAAPRTFSLIDPLSVRGPVAPGDALKKFERAAGFGHPSFTANAAELVALGFRGWPVAGVHSDPDLLLQTPVDFSATVLPGRPGASIAGSPSSRPRPAIPSARPTASPRKSSSSLPRSRPPSRRRTRNLPPTPSFPPGWPSAP